MATSANMRYQYDTLMTSVVNNHNFKSKKKACYEISQQALKKVLK